MKHSSTESTATLDFLTRNGWLAQQPVDFHMRGARAGQRIKLAVRQPVCSIGDPAKPVFGVESGWIDVGILVNEDEEVLVHRTRTGFWSGERALIKHTYPLSSGAIRWYLSSTNELSQA